MAIIVIITKASVSSLESSCFSTYSGAPQGHHVIFPAKGAPPCPLPHIFHCYISYINISLLHPRWDEQCRDTMMTVPPQLTSSLPSFSYPASFRHPPPASSSSKHFLNPPTVWGLLWCNWNGCNGCSGHLTTAAGCSVVWCSCSCSCSRSCSCSVV